MKRYAILKNNVVIDIVNCSGGIDSKKVLNMFYPESTIVEETINTGTAYINGELVNSKFTIPRPFKSWIYINDQWQSSKEYPQDSKTYVWDENMNDWTEKGVPSKIVYAV